MPKKREVIAGVLRQEEIAGGIYDLLLETELAADARPGQFVSLCCRDRSRLLPRPISICDADAAKGVLRLVYRVAGAGTSEFSGLRQGDCVRVIGVLGNGYDTEAAAGKRVLTVGGGLGVPPMLYLSKCLKERCKSVAAVLGYRDSHTFLADEFRDFCDVVIASDDGSVGTHGTVVDAIRTNRLDCDVIMTCGPMPMLRALAEFCSDENSENENNNSSYDNKRYDNICYQSKNDAGLKDNSCYLSKNCRYIKRHYNIKCYVSLEERMACGIGTCLGCVVKTADVDEHSRVNNARICTEGPVFDASEVFFKEVKP